MSVKILTYVCLPIYTLNAYIDITYFTYIHVCNMCIYVPTYIYVHKWPPTYMQHVCIYIYNIYIPFT